MKKIFTLCFLLISAGFTYAQTSISSNIGTNTTWNTAGNPYIITSDIRIDSGVTLTLDPGVEVHIQGSGSLMVLGRLDANGTQSDSILIKGVPGGPGSYAPYINYLGVINMNYTHLDSMKNGIYANNAIINNNKHLARLNIKNSRFTRIPGLGIFAFHNDSSWTYIDSCHFSNCWNAINGQFCTITNSEFISNTNGVLGSDHVIDNSVFRTHTQNAIKLFLPFDVRNCHFEDQYDPALLLLATFGSPGQTSHFENNTLINNDIGLHVYRDTGMISSNNLIIRGNEICSDSINLFYDVFSGSATTIFPILDLKENCWCEWTSPAVWPTFSNPFNKLINIVPIDSTCLPSLVFPGDANHDQVVDNTDLLPIGLNFGQTGPPRSNPSLNWVGQRADDWGTSQANGRDIKHADSDGNGTIDGGDTLAIGLNYGLTHNSWRRPESQGDYLLSFAMPTANILPGDSLSIPVQLGTVDTPALGIYGLAFSINYDPLVLDSTGIKISYANSWLGTKNTDMITFDRDFYSMGQTDIALVRTDQNSQSGHGMIASVIIVISEDIAKKERPIELTFTNVRAIDSLGQAIPLNTANGQAIVAIGTSKAAEAEIEVASYPNPAGDLLYLESRHTEIKHASLHSLEGKQLLEIQGPPGKNAVLNTSQIPSGLYLLHIQTNKGSRTLKIVVQH